MRAFKAKSVALLAIPVLFLSGCGGEANVSDVPEEKDASDFITLVKNTGTRDFEPYESPAVMLEETTLAVHGKIASVSEGRRYDLGGIPQYNVMIGISPDEVIKEDPNRRGEMVYFELPRPENVPVDTYAAKLPLGTEIALFAYPWDDPGFELLDRGAGPEPTASVYGPIAQGLWINGKEGLESVLTEEGVSTGEWSGVESWETLEEAATEQG